MRGRLRMGSAARIRGAGLAGGEDAGLIVGDLGALPNPAGGAFEADEADAVQVAGDGGPGVAGGVLGDADQGQGEEAESDVGADAVFLAVADGSDLEDGLQVAEAAFDVEEAFEQAGGGGEVVVGAGRKVLPVELLLGPERGRADDQGPAAAHTVALEGGVGEQGSLGGEAGQVPGTGAVVAFGLEGVPDQDEPAPAGAFADPNLLDADVVGDHREPAPPGEGLGVGGDAAELLPEQHVPAAFLEQLAVLCGGEAAVTDPEDPVQAPRGQGAVDFLDDCDVGHDPRVGQASNQASEVDKVGAGPPPRQTDPHEGTPPGASQITIHVKEADQHQSCQPAPGQPGTESQPNQAGVLNE